MCRFVVVVVVFPASPRCWTQNSVRNGRMVGGQKKKTKDQNQKSSRFLDPNCGPNCPQSHGAPSSRLPASYFCPSTDRKSVFFLRFLPRHRQAMTHFGGFCRPSPRLGSSFTSLAPPFLGEPRSSPSPQNTASTHAHSHGLGRHYISLAIGIGHLCCNRGERVVEITGRNGRDGCWELEGKWACE